MLVTAHGCFLKLSLLPGKITEESKEWSSKWLRNVNYTYVLWSLNPLNHAFHNVPSQYHAASGSTFLTYFSPKPGLLLPVEHNGSAKSGLPMPPTLLIFHLEACHVNKDRWAHWMLKTHDSVTSLSWFHQSDSLQKCKYHGPDQSALRQHICQQRWTRKQISRICIDRQETFRSPWILKQ